VRFGVSAWLVVLAFGVWRTSPAEARDAAPATPTSVTAAARSHFKRGIELYRAGEYEPALAEFQAAYELKPGPGSLQNVALCQKALLRYPEAVDSLTRLLSHHASELSADERSAAERARAELAALVGSVRLTVVPADADVTLDGNVLSPAARAVPLRLNVGEHTFAASAPGRAPVTKVVKLATGDAEIPIELTLPPAPAVIEVRSFDANAAIAVDGKPVAFGHGVVEVTPGAEHLVQIYKEGVLPFEARVRLEPGQRTVVNGEPGTPASAPSPALSATSAAPDSTSKAALGWYGTGSLSLLATSATPFKFELSNAKSHAWGIGLRAGRRLLAPLAVEGLVEFDVLKVEHACDETASALVPAACGEPGAVVANYLVQSLRFGPTLVLMTTAPHVRLQGGFGFGAVWHELRLGAHENDGVDPFLLTEIGVGANTGHALVALQGQIIIDGTHNLVQARTLGPGGSIVEQAFERSGGALAFIGLNLRVGYSQWAP
jgi:hypothetical protein